jgi:anti-anti-sigma regulatory factor
MENAPSIGSKGITALLSIAQKMQSEERLFSICCPKEVVLRIISSLNIGSFIAVHQTEKQAIDEMSIVGNKQAQMNWHKNQFVIPQKFVHPN